MLWTGLTSAACGVEDRGASGWTRATGTAGYFPSSSEICLTASAKESIKTHLVHRNTTYFKAVVNG